MSLGAVVVDLARYAERALVRHQTRALSVAGAGARLARHALGSGERLALCVRPAHADGFAVGRRLAAVQGPTLAALSLAGGLGAQRVAGCRRADAYAPGQVARRAQLRAGRVAAHLVNAVTRVAVNSLPTRCAHRARSDPGE